MPTDQVMEGNAPDAIDCVIGGATGSRTPGCLLFPKNRHPPSQLKTDDFGKEAFYGGAGCCAHKSALPPTIPPINIFFPAAHSQAYGPESNSSTLSLSLLRYQLYWKNPLRH
ncbi:unnamed protein product [Allacma fusca]|uniref:Uncharacterized protein n=1 Tax=Allacma fusca TaxID=39272 RepID=A0A8J2LH07_9HEXA|nr:unnamed protein product [Allacma fusca]